MIISAADAYALSRSDSFEHDKKRFIERNEGLLNTINLNIQDAAYQYRTSTDIQTRDLTKYGRELLTSILYDLGYKVTNTNERVFGANCYAFHLSWGEEE